MLLQGRVEQVNAEVPVRISRQRAEGHIRPAAKVSDWLNRVEFAEIVQDVAEHDQAVLRWQWLEGLRLYDVVAALFVQEIPAAVDWERCDGPVDCVLRPATDWAERLGIALYQHCYVSVSALMLVEAGPGLLRRVQTELLARAAS